jgi:hypothetical protein
MKRYISHLVFALLGCMALSACVDNDYMELDKGHNELALSTSNTEVVLDEQAHGDDGERCAGIYLEEERGGIE